MKKIIGFLVCFIFIFVGCGAEKEEEGNKLKDLKEKMNLLVKEKKLQEAVDTLDKIIKAENYSNRSEAFRDLIRAKLVKTEWQRGENVAGAITLIYDHHKREFLNKITDVQHAFQKIIISAQHIHLDNNNCLEIVAIKGTSKEARKLTDNLRSIKGMKHATLSMSSTGKKLG